MNSRVIGVWLILRGCHLKPNLISEKLNLKPSKQHIKGLPKQNSPNVVAKTGLWSLESISKSDKVDDHLKDILEKLEEVNEDLRCLKGVEDAFIDIFVSESDGDDNRVTTSFCIDAIQIKKISALGLAIQYTS